jgi:SAM-dependent methyltransferase
MKESWDPIWEKVYKSQEWGKYADVSLIQFVARNFYSKDRNNIKILEIGCGPGANIWYLDREGFDAYGIDGSETAINKAKKRIPKAHLHVGDITNLKYDDNFFDAVVDVECLYSNNLNNSRIILKQISRVLKKTGLFYSRTFSDEMFIGNSPTDPNKFEYFKIDEGPLKNKGFVRLIDKKGIKNIYGLDFNVISIDKLEYTQFNSMEKISEWIIISEKK